MAKKNSDFLLDNRSSCSSASCPGSCWPPESPAAPMACPPRLPMLLIHAYAARSWELTDSHYSRWDNSEMPLEGTWLCLAQAIPGIAHADAPGSSHTAGLLLWDLGFVLTAQLFPISMGFCTVCDEGGSKLLGMNS